MNTKQKIANINKQITQLMTQKEALEQEYKSDQWQKVVDNMQVISEKMLQLMQNEFKEFEDSGVSVWYNKRGFTFLVSIYYGHSSVGLKLTQSAVYEEICCKTPKEEKEVRNKIVTVKERLKKYLTELLSEEE